MQSLLKRFGRFELKTLLGRSALTMVWDAWDPIARREVMLCLPRAHPASRVLLDKWMADVRYAARLEHPHLAPALEIGEHNQWPFVAYERSLGVTLREFLASKPELQATDVGHWAAQVLQALAFAHDAGATHGDLQLQCIFIDDRGRARLAGLACAGEDPVVMAATAAARGEGQEMDTQRMMARRDLLAMGVILHRVLTGQPVLGEEDIGAAMRRIEPPSHAMVKLPWTSAIAVPQGLRAIVNRSTERIDRQRYQTARTFLNAVETWLEGYVKDDSSVIDALIERLHVVGLLPALPGVPECVAHLALMDKQRVDEMAVEVLGDVALSCELLRRANSAQVRASQTLNNGPVLTIRRCIAMVGTEGVRHAANGLRAWPGPLNQGDAERLAALLERIRLAGHVAQFLRPAGYDAEIVYLLVIMQSLGRLMVQYHFVEEAAEIHRLMQPTPGTPATGGLEIKGQSEAAATLSVLGVDMEQIASAVCRYWGLPEDLQHMARRLPTDRPVRACESDNDQLRTTASAAIELVDAINLPEAKRQGGLVLVAQRYGRVLSVTPRDLIDAVEGAQRLLRTQPGMRFPTPEENAAGRPVEEAPLPDTGFGSPSTLAAMSEPEFAATAR